MVGRQGNWQPRAGKTWQGNKFGDGFGRGSGSQGRNNFSRQENMNSDRFEGKDSEGNF